MKRLNYVELDIPKCGNTHGVSPCTATETGDAKCYNSRATCNDLANFRFSTPNVESVTETEFTTNTTAHSVKMPASIESGDLLLAVFANDGSATVTTPTNWTRLATTVSSTLVRGSVYARVATGSEDTANMIQDEELAGPDGLQETIFGDFLQNPANVFEGISNQNFITGGSRDLSVTSAYIGQAFYNGPKSVFDCTVYGSNDQGFIAGINPSTTIRLYAKNDSEPANSTDGTIIGTVTFTDTTNETAGRALTISDTSTKYDYWWVRVSHTGAASDIGITEIIIHTSAPSLGFTTSATEAAAAQVFLIKKNRWSGSLSVNSHGVAIEALAPGSTALPDPPALTPGWGEATNLWFAVMVNSTTATIVSSPPGFPEPNLTQGGTGTTGAAIYSSYVVTKEESLDPGNWQVSSAISDHVVFTIAVQPFEEVSLRFSKAASYLPKDIEAYPNLLEISHTPSVVSLGENLGERGSMTATFEDAPHSDTGPGYDPYLEDRTYDPYEQGTHWGKFWARHTFIQGTAVRMIRGLAGEALAAMDTRHFILETMNGPSTDWKFEIVGKDILKLLDGDKAQAPVVNTAVSAETIEVAENGVTMSPSGIGDDEFSTSGYVCLGGKEVCSYTRTAGSDTLTLVRGLLNTEDVAHEAGVRVQEVLVYDGEDVADIIFDLLVTYGGVPAHLCPLSSWSTESSTYINRQYTSYITEPTSVKQLVTELIEQAALAIWWSDSPPQVNFQVLREVGSSADTIDENLIIKDSLQIEERTEKRLTQVWTFYATRDYTRPLDEESNYRSVVATIDSDATADYLTAGIKKIYSRWIPTGGQTTAERLNDHLLSQYRRAPRRFKFKLFPGGPVVPVLGNGYRVSVPQVQDQNGAQDLVPVIATSIRSEPDGLVVTADELHFGSSVALDVDGNVVTLNSDDMNVDLLTLHDQLYTTAVSGDNVYCFVSSGVTIGSTSTSVPAFTISGFAAGVNIYLILEGRIQGMGGHGGDGGNARGGDGDDGQDGGTALYVRDPVNIDASQGDIWGGGGGGGGGGAGSEPAGASSGGGGGGGGSGTNAGAGNDGGDGVGGGGGGQDGSGGSATAGGTGGNGATGGADGGDGGNGGGPGLDGQNGDNGQGLGGGSGGDNGQAGNAGNAVDGNSFITYGTFDGTTFSAGATGSEDIRGGEV